MPNTPHPHPLDDDHDRRFGGLDRLYGGGARLTLHRARVAVVGVGGVGSWAVEALARSGIGRLTLIDFDHVAVSNVNRQIQALESTLGMAKTEALRTRIADINPACRVTVVDDFLSAENMKGLIAPGVFDVVIDACDEAKVKAALIVHARFNKIPLIVCGAAGGKRDALQLRRDDLGRVTHDALLARIRNSLKKDYNILPRGNGKFGVTCVYLEEPSRRNTTCSSGDLNCSGYGSAVTVTATMGFAAAGCCIDRLLATADSQTASPSHP
jgi:tRNA A37 threonylcarbamoyladenosine dehydratase